MGKLPSDEDVTRLVQELLRTDQKENGQLTLSVRQVRQSIAQRLEIDDAVLKRRRGDIIKEVAEKFAATLDDSDAHKDAAVEDEFSSLDDTDTEAGGSSKAARVKKSKTAAQPASKGGKRQGSSEARSKASTTPGDDPTAAEITKLKKYVVACGVRKMWSKWFASQSPPAETPKAQVTALRQLLSELGMDGRLSMEKAKKIKEEREFKEEMKSIGVDAESASDDDNGHSRISAVPATRRGRKRRGDDDDDTSTSDEDGEAMGPAAKQPRFNASLAAFAAELNSDEDD